MRNPMPFVQSACVLLLTAVTTSLCHAFTAEDFNYTFENLDEGNLHGQDGWSVIVGEARVVNGPGVNTSKTVHGLEWPDVSSSQCLRSLPETFYYTAEDTSVVFSCYAMIRPNTTQGRNAIAGLTSPHSVLLGMDTLGEDVMALLYAGGWQAGDAMVAGAWYEMRLEIDYSVPGGLGTVSYRNLTAGQTTFQIDKTLHDVNLNQPVDVQGRYTFINVYTRQDNGCYIDNIHIDAPRPPCPEDIDPDAGNGTIDIDDYTEVILNWGTNGPQGDVDGDGDVDIDDYTAIVLNWGDCGK